MKSFIMQLREKMALVSEVFAIGQAYDNGQITTRQASNAISQVGLRSDLQQLERASRADAVVPAAEFANAR